MSYQLRAQSHTSLVASTRGTRLFEVTIHNQATVVAQLLTIPAISIKYCDTALASILSVLSRYRAALILGLFRPIRFQYDKICPCQEEDVTHYPLGMDITDLIPQCHGNRLVNGRILYNRKI